MTEQTTFDVEDDGCLCDKYELGCFEHFEVSEE